MTVHDYTPDFVSFFGAIQGKTDAEKLQRFWSDLHPVFPAFYDLRLERWEKQGEDVDAKLLEEFAEFGTYHDEFVRRQTSVPEQLESAVTSFQSHFPDFSPDFDVYLLHSLKSMDGGTRKLDGRHTFIFGLDMMARFHAWEDETPFFHHELLHFYTKQVHAANDWYDKESLLLNLWEEGLAVYVSHLLNPKASYTELTLDFPEGMRERVWEKRACFADELASNLSSTDEDVFEKYFVPWSGDETVPGRAGYFIGYIVLNELAKTYPLETLIEPSSEGELFERIKSHLMKLAELPRDTYFPNPPSVA